MTAGGIYVICIWCHVYFRVVKPNLKLGNKHEHHFAQINQLLFFFENKHRDSHTIPICYAVLRLPATLGCPL